MKDHADTWLQLLCTVNYLKTVCVELKDIQQEMQETLKKLGKFIAAVNGLANQASEFIMDNK
ncbi:MAG: hypothetical protein EBZ69_02155 [Alphaproteobacteria bacterium]|nr:hypothetical protein [Alphaproteobacteria bacterium]